MNTEIIGLSAGVTADLGADNILLREALEVATRRHLADAHDLADIRASAAAAANKWKIKSGWTARQLASSRAETKIGQTDLLASAVALAQSKPKSGTAKPTC